MSTKYGGSLSFLALISLIVLWLGFPLRAAAQSPDAVVAIDPARVTVDSEEAFDVTVTVADAPEMRSYEFTLMFDPAVVEVQAVEQGPFLEGLSPVLLGPEIDNEAGSATFGAFVAPGTGVGPWPSGDGTLATISLRAVRDGFTALDLQDVTLFGSGEEELDAAVEDGQVLVGEGELPSPTATVEPIPTATETATGATATPPESTATSTPTGGTTSPPEATATKTPTGGVAPPTGTAATRTRTGATSPPEGTVTEPPTEGGTPGMVGSATSTAQPGHSPAEGQTPVEEGSPSATAAPAEAEGETVEPTAASRDEPPEGETPWGVNPLLIVAVALLALAGIVLIGAGVFGLGLDSGPAKEPMDDDSEE